MPKGSKNADFCTRFEFIQAQKCTERNRRSIGISMEALQPITERRTVQLYSGCTRKTFFFCATNHCVALSRLARSFCKLQNGRTWGLAWRRSGLDREEPHGPCPTLLC